MNRQPFGFALAAQLSELRSAQEFRREVVAGISRITVNGLVLAVRHYAATPESVGEGQPLANQNVVLSYEGRVDNRQEIAYALGQPKIAHSPDGAVLAVAYEAWGPKLSARVIGEYAYVAFDRRKRRVVAGQDSMGVRRIFYSCRGDQAWITSNLRLLFEQFPEARPSLDRDVLPEYFAGILMPWSGRTIWRGIRELGRGSVLVQCGYEFEEQKAWQPDLHRRLRLRAPEADEAFRKVLFEAVGAALRSPGPVLCDLSGGYDSSTICSVAALLTRAGVGGRPIVGWSYVNRSSDEGSFQEAVRLQHDIDSHVLDVGNYLPFRAFDDAELPTLGFIQFGAVDRAMREFAGARGIRSRLTGYAADALFHKGFPPVYLSEWLREGRVADWARDFAAYVRGSSFSAWHLLRDCTVGSLDLQAGGSRLPLPNWLTPLFREEIEQANHDFLRPHNRIFSSPARELIYRTTLWFIPPHGRLLADERSPFAYRPLVEFMLGLDWEHIVRPGEDRVIMRRALRGILPEAVRTKGGQSHHSATIHEGLRAAWPRMGHLLTGEHLADLGVVERKPFRAAIETMRAGYPGQNTRISHTALYLEAWMSVKAASTAAEPKLSGEIGEDSVTTQQPGSLTAV